MDLLEVPADLEEPKQQFTLIIPQAGSRIWNCGITEKSSISLDLFLR